MATQMMEYGIKCNKEDEKQIVKNINSFLQKEYNYKKLYKRKDDSEYEFKYEYIYCQFIHEKPLWYFDLNPNEDINGKWKFDNKEIQWVLFTAKNDVEEYSKKDHGTVDLFFKKLIDAIGFETFLLHKYKIDEERIGNIIYDDDGKEINN
jgi:hypothetical protein